MYRVCIGFLCAGVLLFSGCFLKKSESSNNEKLSKLGVVVKIPKNYKLQPQEKLSSISETGGGATLVEVEPFLANPLYIYAEDSGKGVIIISELKFMEGFEPDKLPMNNIYNYKKNLDAFFGAGEIGSEEIDNNEITTLLLAMMLQEDGDDIYLFKGLNYLYPGRFFMIDLYITNNDVTMEDAAEYMTMYNSLGIF